MKHSINFLQSIGIEFRRIYFTCVYYQYKNHVIEIQVIIMFSDITFIDGESISLIVELFSSTTIIAYSTSSPLCSRENMKKKH